MARKATSKKSQVVPKGDWPGAWGIYQYSKRAVLQNWQLILGLLLFSVFSSMILNSLFGPQADFTFGDFLNFLVSSAIGVLLTIVYLSSIRETSTTFSEAFEKFNPGLYLKYIGASIVAGFLSAMSLLALVVPFFFVFPRLVMATYLVVDKELGPIEAVKRSWAMTEGHIGKVWGIIGATLVMALPIITIIGLPFALYFIFIYQMAMIVLYVFLQKK